MKLILGILMHSIENILTGSVSGDGQTLSVSNDFLVLAVSGAGGGAQCLVNIGYNTPAPDTKPTPAHNNCLFSRS